MPLPQGSIGCLSTNIVDAWYNINAPPPNANRFGNINFRDAITRAVAATHKFVLFKPDGADVKNYNAPCPENWTRAEGSQMCNAPSTYTVPSGCSNQLGVAITNKPSIETSCRVSYPSYPKGTAWTAGNLPTDILNSLSFADGTTGLCPVEKPVYVYRLEDNKSNTQKCLDDFTPFNRCFRTPAMSFFQNRQDSMSQTVQNAESQLLDSRIQFLALQQNKTPAQIQRELQTSATSAEDRRALAEQMRRRDVAKKDQERVYQNLDILYGARYDQQTLLNMIQQRRLENQKSIQDSSQDIYIQNQKWKMARRLQDLQNEWYDRIIFILYIAIIVMVFGTVAYYYYQKKGFNMNFGN